MKKDRLLWVDDEIDLLRPHILFLESKGYEVHTVSNGQDALDRCRETDYDLIFLDENMPGISGLETLAQIKDISPTVPVIMITKSEEEDIMDMAIGSKIADYLIKPVNPNQILLSLKKNLHRRDIVSEVAQTAYQQNFGKIGMQINDWVLHCFSFGGKLPTGTVGNHNGFRIDMGLGYGTQQTQGHQLHHRFFSRRKGRKVCILEISGRDYCVVVGYFLIVDDWLRITGNGDPFAKRHSIAILFQSANASELWTIENFNLIHAVPPLV